MDRAQPFLASCSNYRGYLLLPALSLSTSEEACAVKFLSIAPLSAFRPLADLKSDGAMTYGRMAAAAGYVRPFIFEGGIYMQNAGTFFKQET